MKKIVVTLCGLLLLASACAGGGGGESGGPKPEILGVRLGMNREEAQTRLQSIGQLEKEERRQQQVWRLAGDPAYSHLMVAYNKQYTAVRYVTAVAHEQGSRIRYADVVDVKLAREEVTPASRSYTQEVPARTGQPAFITKAIGSDPMYLKYYSVESVN